MAPVPVYFVLVKFNATLMVCHIFSDKNIFKVSIVLPIPNYMIEERKDEFTDGKNNK